jgi:hypothetical protein
VSFHVALDEIESHKPEVVKSASLNSYRVVYGGRATETRETIRSSVAENWDVEVSLAGFIGKSDGVHADVSMPASNRTQCRSVFRVRLKGVDGTCLPDEPDQETRVGSPPCANVERDVRGTNQLFDESDSQVARLALPRKLEARPRARRNAAGEPNHGTDGVHEEDGTERPITALSFMP